MTEFAPFIADVARLLWGDPNPRMSNRRELRWGSHGARSVRISDGVWFDNESKTGGGVLDLIERETGRHGQEKITWLREHGFSVDDDRPAPKTNGQTHHAAREIVATYDYCDEQGTRLFQVVRFEPKAFRQRRDPRLDDDPTTIRDGWVWSVKGVRQVPYRLTEMVEAIALGRPVLVVEGEKDVDNLAKLRIVATCNAGGAGKWPAGLSQHFLGADVVLVPDNDQAGQDHVDLVGRELRSVAASLRILRLPGLPEKGDASDWLAAGGTVEQLHALITASPEWIEGEKPFVSKFGALQWEHLDDVGAEHEWLVDGWLTIGDKSVIGGPSKSGKSFLAIHISLAIARGTDFFGAKVLAPGLVIYQAGEGSKGIKKRLRAYREYWGIPKTERVCFVLLQNKIDLYRADGDTQKLIEECRSIAALYPGIPLRALFIDTLATAQGTADENSGRDMGMVMSNIDKLSAALEGCHVSLVHHLNAGGTKLRGHTSVYANIDQVIAVTRDEATKVRTAVLDKQKDGEDGATIDFELAQHKLYQRPDGQWITSCTCVRLGTKEAQRRSYSPTPQEHELIVALIEALGSHGIAPPAGLGVPRSIRTVVRYAHLRDIYGEQRFGSDDPESVKKAIQRAGEKLKKHKIIGVKQPFVWMTGHPVRGFSIQIPDPVTQDGSSSLEDVL